MVRGHYNLYYYQLVNWEGIPFNYLINWLFGKWISGSPLHCKIPTQEMLVDKGVCFAQLAHGGVVEWKVAGIISVVICEAPRYHAAYGI